MKAIRALDSAKVAVDNAAQGKITHGGSSGHIPPLRFKTWKWRLTQSMSLE